MSSNTDGGSNPGSDPIAVTGGGLGPADSAPAAESQAPIVPEILPPYAVPAATGDLPAAAPSERYGRIPPSRGRSGSWWTIPLMCAGICLVACCLLIPAVDANHLLLYQRQKLQADLEHLQKQISVNGEFLDRIADDATLAERLAQRQLKVIRQGTAVLDLEDPPARLNSPFLLVNVPPPAPLAPYEPRGGVLTAPFRNPRPQLYLLGAGLMMIAGGLILGASRADFACR